MQNDKQKTARGGRKTSPRTKKTRDASPASAALKAAWQRPEFRERMRQRDIATAKMRKERPNDFFRRGVPDGMRKPEAMALWAIARMKAHHIMDKLVEEGDFPLIPVPESDEDKAKAALTETFVLALGPTDLKIKMTALRTILDFTKQKPVQKTETKVSAEDFLNNALEDYDKSTGEAGKAS